MNEFVLVPRNLESRKEKLRQQTIKLLQQEVINGDFRLEKWMLDIPLNLIKVKTIDGSLICSYLNIIELPEWFKDLTVNGNFICSSNHLTTLKNCPQNIKCSFYCNDNKLVSLKGCPEIINKTFSCYYNNLESLEYGPKIVKGEYWCFTNKVLLEKPIDCEIVSYFYND